MTQLILAIDQGTTSSRAILFNSRGEVVNIAQQEFTQYFPQNGWVEHSPKEIWQSTLQVCRETIEQSDFSVNDIAAIGITNQRETTIVWDKTTGEPVYNAIVWQDRRTAKLCQHLRNDGLSDMIQEKTGLLLDPYFSATKLKWILDNVDGARTKAEAGQLAFGTVDSFLLWHLTGGQHHATDATNASRTMLLNINTGQWDDELLELFTVPHSMLPEVKDCSADYGQTQTELLGKAVPITGIAGDQQAALIGQACFNPGDIKSTYGTGCFALFNTGKEKLTSKNQLLTTIGYQLDGKITYAQEGSIFIAGAVVQWLRDKLGIIEHARETESIMQSVESTNEVYFIPAFTGLGAPYWQPEARAAILGMTRDTGRAEIVRAAIEAICYQTRDLVEAMQNDGAPKPSMLKVDGGMANNNVFVQLLADMLGVAIERPVITETTALGAAYLAGLKVGVFESLSQIRKFWQADKKFTADDSKSAEMDTLYHGWQENVGLLFSN